jgi:hypothetical protein
MRNYLFRGIRVDNGEWVEGYLFDDGLIDSNRMFIGSLIIEDYKGLSDDAWDITGTCFYEVIPETVGQYTTQDDINGKKIFDGDIVEFQRVNELGYTTRRTGEVKWYDKLPLFYILATTGDGWDWVDCENIEVIENIYDDDLFEEDD